MVNNKTINANTVSVLIIIHEGNHGDDGSTEIVIYIVECNVLNNFWVITFICSPNNFAAFATREVVMFSNL